MTRFNPDFWEVTVSEESWQRFSCEHHLYYEEPAEAERRRARAGRVHALWPTVRDLVEEVLTERQRQVIMLYFLQELNQRQIAEALSISQQSVSEHLYGKIRNGHAVGGALRKLRKACARRGLRWEGPV
jgi:FixJ family two-component response regulator